MLFQVDKVVFQVLLTVVNANSAFGKKMLSYTQFNVDRYFVVLIKSVTTSFDEQECVKCVFVHRHSLQFNKVNVL